jgi:hypothetical protein
MEVYRQNLERLHEFEESLRPQNLALIEKSESLKDHLQVVGEAMNVLHGFTKDHVHRTADELTIQFLGIRVLNAAAVSIKLALSGYYQAAFMHVRDIAETGFLLDYFRSNRTKIAEWAAADNKKLKTDYAPFRIRDALDARDDFRGKKRGVIYALLSEHASHVTYRGFRFTSRENLGQMGPFVDEKKLVAWLEEMAKNLGHCALIYSAHFEQVSAELEGVKARYNEIINAWLAKYLEAKPGTS